MKLKDYIKTVDPSNFAMYRVEVLYSRRGIVEYTEDYSLSDIEVSKFLEDTISVSDQGWDGVFITIRKELNMNAMEKKYYIVLSEHNDFLKIVKDTTWKAVFGVNNATFFDSREEAVAFMIDEEIRSIWLYSKVESTLVGYERKEKNEQSKDVSQ